MNKRLQQIDSETGEIIDGFVAYVVPKRKNGFGQGWLAMAQNGAEILSQSNLSGNDFKVLMKLLSVLDYENLIQVSQADIARELDMHRQHVQRSIKRLLELGIVLEGVRIGISRSYRLNPNFGWKGSAKGHREALADHLKLVK
jgi:biotin operon repressor